MTDNKIQGIVKIVSDKTKGILLITPEDNEGSWYNPISEKVKDYVVQDLRGKEVELSVVDIQKRTFSFLKILNGNNVGQECRKERLVSTEEQRRYRAMSVSYAKDLLIADKVKTKNKMMDIAQCIFLFIMEGVKEENDIVSDNAVEEDKE